MGVVRAITGRGITTSIAMESADLGAVRWDEKRNAYALLFGDNFEHWRLAGEWRSPSIVMYDENFNVKGVPTVVDGKQVITNGRVTQLWAYQHDNPEFSTVLPCDFIKIGEWWYIYVMVTKGLGNERWTGWRRSKDLVSWELVKTLAVSQIHPGQVMLTFEQFGDDIFIFGTGGLARNKDIWAWRCPVSKFPLGDWQPLNNGDPVLRGRFGELCLRNIQGNAVLSYFDAGAYKCTARTVKDPSHDWVTANVVDFAWGQHTPQLYGGYVSPNSRLNEPNGMKFLVSQWITSSNDPYHVLLFEDTLQAKGPLEEVVVEEPEESPVSEEPVETEQPTQNNGITELISVLVKELSRSGSVAILDADGKKRTLREALEAIHWKEITQLTLGDRPRHPKEEDDQFGHVLNARAEGLITLALVERLAAQSGIKTDELIERVRESFK